MMYGSWDIKHNRQFFVILGYFLPFYPHNNPENQKFEKMKKPSWDIFMLHMSKIIWCMIPEIWNATDKIFLILDQFLSFNRFPPLNNPKNQNFENLKKNPRDIIILHKCTKNHGHRLYCFWDMACDRCRLFFALLPP